MKVVIYTSFKRAEGAYLVAEDYLNDFCSNGGYIIKEIKLSGRLYKIELSTDDEIYIVDEYIANEYGFVPEPDVQVFDITMPISFLVLTIAALRDAENCEMAFF